MVAARLLVLWNIICRWDARRPHQQQYEQRNININLLGPLCGYWLAISPLYWPLLLSTMWRCIFTSKGPLCFVFGQSRPNRLGPSPSWCFDWPFLLSSFFQSGVKFWRETAVHRDDCWEEDDSDLAFVSIVVDESSILFVIISLSWEKIMQELQKTQDDASGGIDRRNFIQAAGE